MNVVVIEITKGNVIVIFTVTTELLVESETIVIERETTILSIISMVMMVLSRTIEESPNRLIGIKVLYIGRVITHHHRMCRFHHRTGISTIVLYSWIMYVGCYCVKGFTIWGVLRSLLCHYMFKIFCCK